MIHLKLNVPPTLKQSVMNSQQIDIITSSSNKNMNELNRNMIGLNKKTIQYNKRLVDKQKYQSLSQFDVQNVSEFSPFRRKTSELNVSLKNQSQLNFPQQFLSYQSRLYIDQLDSPILRKQSSKPVLKKKHQDTNNTISQEDYQNSNSLIGSKRFQVEVFGINSRNHQMGVDLQDVYIKKSINRIQTNQNIRQIKSINNQSIKDIIQSKYKNPQPTKEYIRQITHKQLQSMLIDQDIQIQDVQSEIQQSIAFSNSKYPSTQMQYDKKSSIKGQNLKKQNLIKKQQRKNISSEKKLLSSIHERYKLIKDIHQQRPKKLLKLKSIQKQSIKNNQQTTKVKIDHNDKKYQQTIYNLKDDINKKNILINQLNSKLSQIELQNKLLKQKFTQLNSIKINYQHFEQINKKYHNQRIQWAQKQQFYISKIQYLQNQIVNYQHDLQNEAINKQSKLKYLSMQQVAEYEQKIRKNMIILKKQQTKLLLQWQRLQQTYQKLVFTPSQPSQQIQTHLQQKLQQIKHQINKLYY